MRLPKPFRDFFPQFFRQSKRLFGFTFRDGPGNFIIADISLFTKFIKLANKIHISVDGKGQAPNHAVTLQGGKGSNLSLTTCLDF